jgi:cytochrome c-type biogenesis protein CcmH
MTLWIIFALMTAAAVLAVLWPLGRRPDAGRGGSDRLVYQDQLQEIERDRAAGLIGEADARAARVEVSRRLLAAADREAVPAVGSAPPMGHRGVAAVAAIVIVPAIALGFYLWLGSPGVPGQPVFARNQTPPDHESIPALVGQVEAHLARNPNDGAGWEVIAPVYLTLGRFDDAVAARRKSIALNGDSATRESNLGEALVAAANGVVTAEAKLAFEHAVAADQHEVKARYFLGLADEQDGDRDGAASKWRALLGDATGEAPWANFVRTALARVTGGPNPDDVAAAESMSDARRAEMVRGMVQRLADRLHSDSSDVDGWLRLVRAYVVLGDRDKAKSAAADARHALSNNPDEIKRINDLVKSLGLEG